MVVGMILECPACHARFSVADHLIPVAGRKVRCSKCTHTWHVDRASVPVTAPQPLTAVEAPSSDAMPSEAFFAQAAEASPARRFNRARAAGATTTIAARPPRSATMFKIAAPVLAMLWLVAAVIAYFPSWVNAPVLAAVYRAIGTQPTDGLDFADVNMTREQEGSKTRFVLTGSIRNNTNVARAVPTVRVLLKDKQNKTIWGREYPVNTQLKAGDVYPFRIANVETTFAKNVSSIVVDMGNSLQLMVR
jgi:predicted Zn finger-like uncharacterized protein